MHVAKLTQDYFSYFQQSVPSGKEPGTDKLETKRPRPSILPAERVVEGEVLRNRSKRTGAFSEETLQCGRFAAGSLNYNDETISAQAAQRAVSAYLDYAATPDLSVGDKPRTVDYYA